MRALRMSFLLMLACIWAPARAADVGGAARLDDTARTVVMTAFGPEWDALAPAVTEAKEYRVNGLTFLTGKLDWSRELEAPTLPAGEQAAAPRPESGLPPNVPPRSSLDAVPAVPPAASPLPEGEIP